MDCWHWFGIPPIDCDVRHWIPFMDAELTGENPAHKLTLPLPRDDDRTPGRGGVMPSPVARRDNQSPASFLVAAAKAVR